MERLCAADRSARIAISAAMIMLFATLPLAAEERAHSPSESEISQWITDLGSPSFQAREMATLKLLKAGPPAIKPVFRATQYDDPEVATRSVRILTKMATDDGMAFDALAAVASSDTDQAVIAGQIFRSPAIQASPQKRARKRISQLVKEAQLELDKGNIGPARVKAEQARKLCMTPNLGAIGRGQLAIIRQGVVAFDFKFLDVHLAVESGFPEARIQLNVLRRQEALRLLGDARVAIKKGNLGFARNKVLAAQKVGYVFGIHDDRPDLVLEKIEQIDRARVAEEFSIAEKNRLAEQKRDVRPKPALPDLEQARSFDRFRAAERKHLSGQKH